jgi:integrase
MRGSLRRRGPSWAIVLDQDRQPGGGRKQKFITFRGTREQAEKELNRLVGEMQNHVFVEPTKLTFGAWLTRWITALASSPANRPATIARYQSVVDRLQVSTLAAMPLQRLLPSDVETYYGDLMKTLKPGTIRVHHVVLRRALRKAIKARLVTRNVCDDVENLPKAPKDKGKHARAGAWTKDEARAFLAAADAAGSQASAFYALALDSGARLSELAGLRWVDLDLEDGTLTIAQQLARGKTGDAPTWGPTKSGETRQIIVTPETVARLKAHRQHQAELKMKNRTRYQDFGLVFAKEHAHVRRGKDSLGQPIQVNNIGEREFGRLIEAAGVRRIRFHDLRHTTATLALAHGEPVRDVADRLGHSKTSMTWDIYAHATERKAPTTIRAVLFG